MCWFLLMYAAWQFQLKKWNVSCPSTKSVKRVMTITAGQRFSNFFSSGDHLSQNILRTTLLLAPLKANLSFLEMFWAYVNLLAPEFGIKILAHPVCKMRIIQEPKKVALWNKRHFEEKKRRACSMFKKFRTNICWKKYIKWGVWRVAVCPSYI
jgi:hypothetical protein